MTLSTRVLLGLIAAAGLFLPLAGCDAGETDETMLLRVVHAAAGTASIEFLIDFDLFTRNLAFRDASPYTQWDAGLRLLEARTQQGNRSVMREVLFQEQSIHTVLVTGLDDPSDLVVLEDDRSTVSSGTARLRVVNVASSINTLNVVVTQQDPPSSLDVTVSGFGNTSAYLSTPAGVYTLSARSLDGSISLPPLSLSLESGRRYLLVAANTALFAVADG